MILHAKKAEAVPRGSVARGIVENHQLVRVEGQNGKGTAVAISKLNFTSTILIDHHNRADLAPA